MFAAEHVAAGDEDALRVGGVEVAVEAVAGVREEVVEREALGGSELAEDFGADHGALAFDDRQQRGEDRAIVAFGVDLQVAELRQPFGVFGFEHAEQIAAVDGEWMTAAVEPPALLRFEAAVAERGVAVVEDEFAVAFGGGEALRDDVRLVAIERGIRGEDFEDVRVGLQGERATSGAGGEGQRHRGVARVGADVDHEVAGADETADGVDCRLRDDGEPVKGVLPLREFDAAIDGEVEGTELVAELGEGEFLAAVKESIEAHGGAERIKSAKARLC